MAKRSGGKPGAQPAKKSTSTAAAQPSRRRSMVDIWAIERVPEGADYTGMLRTPNATPFLAIAGIALGIGSFAIFTPILSQALVALYWLVTGRPGTFAETYASLMRYESPFGMVAAQLGVALLIVISAALFLTMHHVRPGYLFSVRPGMRWRPFGAFALIAAVIWVSYLLVSQGSDFHPQAGFAGFLVAILLTSPLQAAAEEVFFRGYLLAALGSLASNRWFGILASAALFALFHGTQNGWLFASRFAFGVLAAVLVVWTGGLEAGIAAHVVNNVCAFTYAGLTTGIAELKAVRETTPVEALAEIAVYAVFTAAALIAARRMRMATRTGSV